MLPELPLEKRFDVKYISQMQESEFENLGVNTKLSICKYFPQEWQRLTESVLAKYSGNETICDMVRMEFSFIEWFSMNPKFNN